METAPDNISGTSLTFGLLIGAIVLYIVYDVWSHTYFIRRGIPGPRPVPVLGNVLDWRKGIHYAFDDYLKKYGNGCGIYEMMSPIMVITDPEMIKQIMVKHFDQFVNRRAIPIENPNINQALFISRDEQWRKIRHTLTPTFSGRKMKLMSSLINDCADTLVENFAKACKHEGNGLVECKELFGAYIMDSIAICAFGLKVNSQNNKDDPFVTYAKRFFASINFVSPIFIISALIPGAGRVLSWFGFTIFPNDVIDFFKEVVDRAIAFRKRGDALQSVDFLQLMLNAEESDANDQHDHGVIDDVITPHSTAIEDRIKRRPLNREEVTSQALSFFIAGYETTTAAICFTSYLLATNPKEQDKLIEEIDKIAPSRDDVTYDNLKNLTYLDGVVCESLRLYPPGATFDRICNETVTIKGHVIPKGMRVFFAAWTTHRDPEYWPDPEKFDPERFSKENRDKRHSFAWIPFGGGPRLCIGIRFALMEIKMAIVRILQEVRLETSPETEIPPVLGTTGFISPPNGITLRAVSRFK